MPVTLRFEARDFAGSLGAATAGLFNRVTGKQQAGFQQAAEIYLVDQLRRFDAYMGGGGEWAELAPSTVKQKGGDRRILYRTGQMRESLRPGAAGNVLRVTGSGFTAGTADPKAPFHQSGRWKLPKRTVVGQPSPEARQQIAAVMKQTVRDSVFGAFRRR